MSSWRAWGRRGTSFADSEGRRVDTSAGQGLRRFFVRYPGARCARCNEYRPVTALGSLVPGRGWGAYSLVSRSGSVSVGWAMAGRARAGGARAGCLGQV